MERFGTPPKGDRRSLQSGSGRAHGRRCPGGRRERREASLSGLTAPPAPPVPELRQVLHELSQAADAIERAQSARGRSSIEDAIRSARFFLRRARAALPKR